MEKDNELLTVEEVAAFLKIHPRTAWRKINEGTLPGYRLPGSRRVYVRRSDLLAALERVEPTLEEPTEEADDDN